MHHEKKRHKTVTKRITSMEVEGDKLDIDTIYWTVIADSDFTNSLRLL